MYTPEQTKEIAAVIWQQLVCTNKNAQMVMCWGTNQRLCGQEEHNGRNMAFLRFRVEGLRLKGTVKILFNAGADHYHILFYKKGANEPYKSLDGIYWEEMTEIIDREVESGDSLEEYREAVGKAKYKF